MPAKTISINRGENLCTKCVAEDAKPPHYLEFRIDTDSDGIGQRLYVMCPTHGRFQTLYNFPVDPVNRKLFKELFEDDFGPIAPEPKPTKWV